MSDSSSNRPRLLPPSLLPKVEEVPDPLTGLTPSQANAIHRVYMLLVGPYWEVPSIAAMLKADAAEAVCRSTNP